MNDFETVQVEISHEVASITLNRPNSLNALNLVLIKELNEVLKQVSLNDSIKILVLKGSGRAFSSGGDIKEMLKLDGKDAFLSIMKEINELVIRLYTIPKLTIAAINGAAAGLGLSIALAADYVICHENSKLAMNFIGIGLVPDGGGHFHLERRIGEEKAKQLIWEGKILNSQEAKQAEIIDKVVEDINEAVNLQINLWKSRPIRAMIESKKIYYTTNQSKLMKMLELETHAQWEMRQSSDHREGIKAFVEKRIPIFTGE